MAAADRSILTYQVQINPDMKIPVVRTRIVCVRVLIAALLMPGVACSQP